MPGIIGSGWLCALSDIPPVAIRCKVSTDIKPRHPQSNEYLLLLLLLPPNAEKIITCFPRPFSFFCMFLTLL
jgi:hypothetical protein